MEADNINLSGLDWIFEAVESRLRRLDGGIRLRSSARRVDELELGALRGVT